MENSTRSAVLLSVIAVAMMIHCCLADHQQYKVDESREQWGFLTNPKAWNYILASEAPSSSAEAPKSSLRHHAKTSGAPTSATSPAFSATPSESPAVTSASSTSGSPSSSPASPPAQNGSPTIYSVKNFVFAGICMIVAIWV